MLSLCRALKAKNRATTGIEYEILEIWFTITVEVWTNAKGLGQLLVKRIRKF